MQYIRETYKVPAKRGARVRYTGDGHASLGTVLGSHGARLRVQIDGEPAARTFHPTWEIEYLDAEQERNT